ncbi:hypothetical protein DCAR_0309874 [Daucus carota subsp. sativus]|uniref:Uncharacterized protein n=1 Tax=Daucus carota subsp. sativus TaxID=79200 RepID=A0A165ZFT8_DAUCS|nr:hypothetical protein DCAR_0309874 [Daucus carota subsp. sativus]
MPTPSLQLSAQSRQRTPEAQSRQNATVVQSNPSSRNILSTTDGNDKVCWKIGSTSGDGRMRVEVINGVLEPSYDCSARIRKILYQELEPTGYNWKAISQLTKKFYFDEFKKIQLKRDPTADELFRETHIRHLKKNKNLIGGDDGNCLEDDNNVDEEEEILWIDKKSQQTYDSIVGIYGSGLTPVALVAIRF